MVAISIFLSSLGLTNAHKGGIIGVDWEVSEMPANSYTQTTSCNGNSFDILYAIIFIIVFSLIGFLIYSVTRKASPKNTKKLTKAKQSPTFTNDNERQMLCKKIHALDPTDLSKAAGFIEALLSAEKYSKLSPENSKESE